MSGDREEQFILRCQDPAMADRIRRVLREDPAAAPADAQLEIHFDEKGSGRTGTFVCGGDTFPLAVQDLPTIVESYKTYDDIHLVKSTDIGQVLLVGATEQQLQSTECRDGVTPPMRDARRRVFAPTPVLDPDRMRKLEEDLLTIAMGEAPAGMEFIDVEEEFVVDESGAGAWVPVSQLKPQQAAVAQLPGKAKKGKAAKKARSGGAKGARSGSPAAPDEGPDVENF